MNKKIKEVYENVVISKDIENKIMDKTVNKKKSIIPRYVYVVGMLLVFGIFFGTVVDAEDIEKLWVKIFEHGAVLDDEGNRYQMYEEVNGVHYKDLSGKVTDIYIDASIDEVEELVGIKLLKYDKATSNDVEYELITNKEINSKYKERVERIYIRQLDFYKDEQYGWNESIGIHNGFSLSIRMISDKADESTILSYLEEMNTTQGKRVIEEYYSDNLDTKVILYDYVCNYDGCNDRDYSEIYAMFVYKNIRYEFSGYFNEEVPIDKLKEMIEDMHE